MSQKTLVSLGTLDGVSFETVWKLENDFTEWLIEPDNLQILSDTVGIEILEPKTQVEIGRFFADIVASDENNNKIIIENQRNETNHDHLGKVLTYAAGKSANTIIWITEKTTEEHRAVFEWLNKNTNEKIAFFLLELKLWKIGNSNPAIQFDIIEQPNNWIKEISKDNITDTELKRQEFWKIFQDYAFDNVEFEGQFSRRKENTAAWLNYSIGCSSYHLSINQIRKSNKFSIRLWIPEDKNIFDNFYDKKEEIENELKEFPKINWQRLDNKKSSHIDIDIENVEFDNINKEKELTNKEKELFDKIIQIMLKMKKVFKKLSVK